MTDVIVVIGPGQIGQAIARRVGVGKHVLLADLRKDNAVAAAGVLSNAGYEVSVGTVVLIALLLISGSQFTLFAMWFDMESNKDLGGRGRRRTDR